LKGGLGAVIAEPQRQKIQQNWQSKTGGISGSATAEIDNRGEMNRVPDRTKNPFLILHAISQNSTGNRRPRFGFCLA
jgi:hypothetical protein